MSKKHYKGCSKNSYPLQAGYPPVVVNPALVAYGAAGSFDFNKIIYQLLLLIVIVLQFGRRDRGYSHVSGCGESITGSEDDGQLIDNSVLFIIIVFLLLICSGCWTGFGGYSRGGYGY